MSKHTPGPWQYEGPDQFGDYTIHAGDLAIAAVPNGIARELRGEGREQSANARLIGAAPELLGACIQARAAFPDAWFAKEHGVPRDLIKLLDAVIAKAEGRQS